MTHIEHLEALFEDAAKRHPDILHSDTLKTPRFYAPEWEEMMVQAGGGLAALHWTLILEETLEEYRDNNGDYHSLNPIVSFMVGRHVPHGKAQMKREAYAGARNIVLDITAKLKEHEMLGCDADLPEGLKPPANVDLNTLRLQRLQLPLLDNAYGYRASIRIRLDGEAPITQRTLAFTQLDEA